MSQTSQKNKKPGFFNRLLWVSGAGILIFSIFFMAIYVMLQGQLPDVSSLVDVHLQVPMRVYSRDGKLIAQFGDKRREPVIFSDIPPLLVKGVLATEDARFYEHSGVDVIGLARAALVMLKSGRKAQGASTITMQVARNFYLTRKKTFRRKFIEIMLAMKIDNTFSKDAVLSLYLNKIYFGNRAYGVGAAARVYYGLPLNKLDLAQMAMIAGLPQSPSRNNPIRNPHAAVVRRNHVLDRMFELHMITQEQHDKAYQAVITAKYHRQEIGLYAPYVAETVRRALFQRYGSKAYEKGIDAYTTIDTHQQEAAQKALKTGLINYSFRHGYPGPMGHLLLESYGHWLDSLATYPTILELPIGVVSVVLDHSVRVLLANGDSITIPWVGLSWAKPALPNHHYGRAPQQASDVVSVGDVIRVRHMKKAGKLTWILAPSPKVQGALVSLDPDTGGIHALVGGFNFKLSRFNRALQAQRQPGSSFKPFIYSSALNQGFTLASIINDAPVILKDTGENEYWRPENDTRRFYGPTTLQEGLTHSRNLVSIRLLQKMGIKPTIAYASRFGFDNKKLPHSLSLALGSGLVTPLQLAQGYAVFANGGFFTPAHLLTQVNMQGKPDWKYDTPKVGPACWPSANAVKSDSSSDSELSCDKPAITAQNAYLMTEALQDVIQHGTGRAARVLKRHDLSGKTGTTNKQLDAWFAGFNRHLVTVVWVGFDKMISLKEYGAQAALPIWIQYMKAALAGDPEEGLLQPEGIVAVRINKKTGQVDDVDNKNTRLMYFRSSHAPSADPSESTDNDLLLKENATADGAQAKTAQGDQGDDIF